MFGTSANQESAFRNWQCNATPAKKIEPVTYSSVRKMLGVLTYFHTRKTLKGKKRKKRKKK
jgi:hypothetical protein